MFRSRNPPLPSLTLGSTKYRLSPLLLCLRSRSSSLALTKLRADPLRIFPANFLRNLVNKTSSPVKKRDSSIAVRIVMSSLAWKMQSSTSRVACPTLSPISQSMYKINSTTSRQALSAFGGVINSKSISEPGARRWRP